MRLIVTGFGPFAGVATNPTAQLIDFLRSQPGQFQRLGAVRELDARVLDVSARACDAFAADVAAALRPKTARGAKDAEDAEEDADLLIIVHLGVDACARYGPAIALERCAFNECGFRCPDEDGVVLGADRAVVGPSACPLGARLETGIDLERLRARMEARRDERGGTAYEVRISEDAGRFLCNYVYCRSLAACKESALFVHVPPFSVLGEAAQREALLDLLHALVEMAASGS